MIYDHSQALEDIIAELTERQEAGEDVSQQLAELSNIKAELKDQYVEELCKVMRENQAWEESLASEIKRLTEKKQRCAKHVESCKRQLEAELIASGEKKLQAGVFTVSNLKSQTCVIYEEDFDDDRFQTITEVRKIDKMAVKAALKSGEVIKGATLEEKNNIQVK